MYEITKEITQNLISDYLTEKQIFEYYLGIPVVFNKLLRSPIRQDKKPTVSFYTSQSGKLMYKDFGNGFCTDAIGIVVHRFGINYYEALGKIYNDLILNQELEVIPEYQKIKYEHKKKLLQVKRREVDENYWRQFHISRETLNLYKVTGLQTLWSDGKIIYSYNDSDPAHLYDFGEETYKAYFPLRSEYRFIGNASQYVIQGYNQLPKKGKLLIITKALKDVMVLRELGFDAIAPQAESVLISLNQMLELKSRFKKIISLMDFDYAGVVMMNKMKRIYKIPPYMLTNGRFYTPNYHAKDISDLIKLIGKEALIELINERL